MTDPTSSLQRKRVAPGMALKPLLLPLAGAILTLSAVTAGAQTAPQVSAESTEPRNSQDVPAASTGLSEVVVTARYTKENLQTTPLAITAVSQDQLKAANVTNISSLGALVPNLYTHPGDADEGYAPTIVMRGVVENDASYASEPAVGIYIDDVYHGTVVGAALNLADIDHVEVKRGPQGTLEGNASIGGSISLYSKLPQGDNSGYIDAQYGSFNKVQIDAAFDTKIAPDLFARISGSVEHQDGFVDILDFTCEMQKLGTPQLAGTLPVSSLGSFERGCKTGEEGGTNDSSIKLMLRYAPGNGFEANYQISYAKNDDQDSPELLINTTNPYPNSNALVSVYNDEIQKLYGIQYDNRFKAPPGKPYSVYSTFCRPSFGSDVVQQAPFVPVPNGFCYPNSMSMNALNTSLRLDYDITSKIHAKGIFAYSDYEDVALQNGDESPLGYVLSYFDQPIKQYTAELRVNGLAFNDRLTWVSGAFYLTSHAESNGSIGYIADNFQETDTAIKHTASVFAHGDYAITDKWHISGGARYSGNELTYHFDHENLLIINTPFTAKANRTDWLASTSYQITDGTMAYFTAATGSRPPGITTIVNTAQQLSPIPAEELTAYELGLKNEFFDHRVRFNVDIFHSDYSKRLITEIGYQCIGQPGAPTWMPTTDSCNVYTDKSSVPWYITSAKPATVDGLEFELTAKPISNLLVNFNGGYNNFKSSVNTPGAPGYIAPGNLQQPHWNLSGGAQYNLPFTWGDITPRVDWTFQTAQTFNPSASVPATPDYTVNAYSIFNGQISYTPKDSKWSAIFSVTNLTNKFYYYQIFGGGLVNISSNVAPPREFFLRVRRDF
jgi:iron complex outermembrane receptor protein